MRAFLLLAFAACTSDPPSCQQAMTHFYVTGCTFIGTNGQPTSQLDATNACNQIAVAAPSQCVSKLDDWLTCLDEVKGPASTAACDCSQRFQAIETCR